MSFEPNVGQTDPQFRYVSRGSAYDVYMADAEVVFEKRASHSSDHPLRMKFIDPARIKVSAEDELMGRSNYLVGREPSKWHTDIRQFGKVRYTGIAPGVNALFYGQQGKLEYDLIIAPGASDATAARCDNPAAPKNPSMPARAIASTMSAEPMPLAIAPAR